MFAFRAPEFFMKIFRTTLFAAAGVFSSGIETVSVTKLAVALQEMGVPELPCVPIRVAPL